MAEWLIAPVLKTGIVLNKELSRVRIPLSPFCSLNRFVSIGFSRIGIIKKGGMARLSHLAKPEKSIR